MAKALRKIGRFGRRVLDLVPLTPLGLFVGLGAAAALKWLAYPELDLVWLVVGFAALGLLAAAALAVIFGAVWMKVATRRRPHEDVERRKMETGRALPTGFDASTLWILPLVQVSWTWESPEEAEVQLRKQRGRWQERVKLARRGHVRGIRRRIVVQDAFGLARLAIRQRDPEELTVLPHVGKLGETPMLVSLAGGDERPHPMGVEDGDRVELRRYVPGDPARFIHWKVFGRTRKLMVRVPERALSPSRRTVAYQVAGPSDDASAAAARVAIEAGVFGADWSFGADGTAGDTKRVDEAIERIVRSADARDQGGRGLEAFLRRAEQAGPASAVIFVPPRPGPWLDHVVRATRARAARTRFVVASDGIDLGARPPLWRRLLLSSPAREGTPAAELDAVLRGLASSRAEVIVVDRKSGRRLGDAHRAAMRKLERREAA
ncbi:MAG: DUF58 domain-containing protein [Myxococcota bacterium]|nr:DUF58 domain-containing protein [Myxococcota bacterium]